MRPLLLALAAALVMVGCGARSDVSKIHGNTLTIYSSLPVHGVSASTAGAVAAGEGFALSEAGHRAAHRRVRLVRLDSTRAGGRVWEPALVSANAKRAANDPTTIAYLGDLDYGASAVSLPITNEKSIVQVSPNDSPKECEPPFVACCMLSHSRFHSGAQAGTFMFLFHRLSFSCLRRSQSEIRSRAASTFGSATGT